MDETPRPAESGGEPADRTSSASISPREAERASLRSLRDHVTRAVEEIVRLRAQNKSLARRLAEFEAGAASRSSILEEEEDVDELKARISSFISSIDTYLSAHGNG